MTDNNRSDMENQVVEPESAAAQPQPQSQFETIGTVLRKAREEKGYSLKKISHHTKISVTLLEALECDDLERLPNKAYVMGFIKSYAPVVELNTKDCLEILQGTYEALNFERKKPVIEVIKEKEVSSQGSPLIIAALAVVFIVIGVSVYLFSSKKEEIAEQAPKEDITTQELTENTPLKPETKIEINETVAKTDESEQTQPEDVNVASEAPVTENEPAPTEKPKVETVAEQSETAEKEVKPVKKETDKKEKIQLRQMSTSNVAYSNEEGQSALDKYVPKNMQAAIIPDKQNVFVNAVEGDTWITYKKDSNPIKQFTLEKGKTILIRGDDIRLFLGNVHATKIFHNNKMLAVKSRSGVKSLVFPTSKASNYKLPLFVYKDGKVMTSDEYEKEFVEEDSSEEAYDPR